ncbi:MAG TPA: type II toxin-antitoxin system HigB family toxin [Chthonomonadaceae bacterium]|nr:type II toxin-antitoxin system HigB family toxin [Chthonomonadaceae bacterium]
MRVFAFGTLRDFWLTHAGAEEYLRAWYQDAETANWHSPRDIKDTYPHASIIANNRVVFNVKGNEFRLVVKIHYNTGRVFVRFVGTHREYDQIDAETI